jgi:hypothetical protein
VTIKDRGLLLQVLLLYSTLRFLLHWRPIGLRRGFVLNWSVCHFGFAVAHTGTSFINPAVFRYVRWRMLRILEDGIACIPSLSHTSTIIDGSDYLLRVSQLDNPMAGSIDLRVQDCVGASQARVSHPPSSGA